MSRRKTHEEFIAEMKIVNSNIEIISTYESDNIKVKCRCKIDEHIWKTTPSNLLQGYGCPKCNGGVALSTEEFIQKLKMINPNIEVRGNYKNYTTPVLCFCHKCHSEVLIKPMNVLSSGVCPNCRQISIKRRKQEKLLSSSKKDDFNLLKNTFLSYMQKFHSDIELISEYMGQDKSITCRCKVDGHIWDALPRNLMRKSSRSKCPRCNGRYRTTKTLQEDLSKINSYITLLSDYIRNDVYIQCKCKLCGHEWSVKPNNLLNGRGCPHCKISNGEFKILSYLNKNNIKYESQKKFDNLRGECRRLRYDFYLPNHNLLIEFNGIQHEKPVKHFGGEKSFEITQKYDNIKREYAKDNNLELLEIWYYDIDNIESILDKKLNININNKKSA